MDEIAVLERAAPTVERFLWLISLRSTVIQPSPVHNWRLDREPQAPETRIKTQGIPRCFVQVLNLREVQRA